jgi:hypothetical protein
MTYPIGCGALAVLLLIVGVVVTDARSSPVRGLAESIGSRRPSVAPRLPTGPPGHGVTEPIVAAIPRLTAAFERALLKEAPFGPTSGYPPSVEVEYSDEQGFPIRRDGDLYPVPMQVYAGYGYARRHGRDNRVTFVIGWGRTLDLHCPSLARDCSVHTGATGQRVMVDLLGWEEHVLVGTPGLTLEERLVEDGFVDTTVSFYVWVDRGDGSYVWVRSEPAAPDGTLPSRIPTVSLAMLERIALDPGLTVHP